MTIDDQWDRSDQSGLVGKVAAGRYLIVSELGADGRRTRYEAEDNQDAARIWLEVLHAKVTTIDDARLRSLRHPNLPDVLAAGKLDTGEPYLAIEMVRGKSLRAQILAGHLEQRRALSIVRQVLQALAAAHAVGAIHGDVRPENVVISVGEGGDRATLLDLGVAMLSGSDRVGDPRYRAPERAAGSADARTDIYAVGAMLFELLTDHPMFFADEASALIRMHAYAPVQTLERRAPQHGFTPELEALVARAIAKQPGERFQSADEMIVALDAAVASVEAASVAASAAKPPAPGRDASLDLLAVGLVPVAARSSEPVIPMNTSREVPELPWPTRLRKRAGALVAWVRRLDRKYQLIGAVLVVLVVVLVIGLVARHGGAGSTPTAKIEAPPETPIVARARKLLAAGDAKQASELLANEIARDPDDAAAHLVQGHAKIALGHPGEALGAYGRAIRIVPSLANDPFLVANVVKIVTSRDVATAKAALELLSSSSSAQARDAIVSLASTSAVADLRHRAVAIAEHDGTADKIDRVASWALDLRQAKTCDDRRALIAKLAETGDRRALPALKQARGVGCVKREATAAIQKLSTAPTPH